MFSDTHCHLSKMKERGISIPELLRSLEREGCPFLLDAGTEPDDLDRRLSLWASREDIPPFICFSAGIWPSADAIRAREQAAAALENSIESFRGSERSGGSGKNGSRLVAVGECGLDHHWNPSGKDGAAADRALYTGEQELFEAQLELARRLNMPVIVHSRDAFDDTFGCIRNTDSHRGVIHCYSYGKTEAARFLDEGWHISLSGAVTYAKKRKPDISAASLPSAARPPDEREIAELVRYIPRDRLLLETDAPYLAPVPYRGKANTPLFIRHTYEFVSRILDIPVGELAVTVRENARDLFGL